MASPLRSARRASICRATVVTLVSTFGIPLALLSVASCNADNNGPAPVVTPDPNPVTGTWTVSGPDLVNYTFTLTQGMDGVITGTWRGNRIGCTDGTCALSGSITGGPSAKADKVVKIFFMADGQEYLGGFFEASMQDSNNISGHLYLWFSSTAYDADYSEPVKFSRSASSSP
jgi:hypothetical protein